MNQKNWIGEAISQQKSGSSFFRSCRLHLLRGSAAMALAHAWRSAPEGTMAPIKQAKLWALREVLRKQGEDDGLSLLPLFAPRHKFNAQKFQAPLVPVCNRRVRVGTWNFLVSVLLPRLAPKLGAESATTVDRTGAIT